MAHNIRIVTESQLREIVSLDLSTIDVIEKAFGALASGEVVMPPILSMELEKANGEVDVTKACRGAGIAAAKKNVSMDIGERRA